MFSKFGPIESLKIRSKQQSNTFAFIVFIEETDAIKAKETMDNSDFEGKPLTVQYSFNKEEEGRRESRRDDRRHE